MNFIQWGLDWHNKLRNESTTTLAVITHSGGTLEVPASLIDPDSYINPQGVRVNSDIYTMMFNTSDVKRVRFTRGVKIVKDNRTYEVVLDKTKKEELDDPERNTTNVPVKLCS